MYRAPRRQSPVAARKSCVHTTTGSTARMLDRQLRVAVSSLTVILMMMFLLLRHASGTSASRLEVLRSSRAFVRPLASHVHYVVSNQHGRSYRTTMVADDDDEEEHNTGVADDDVVSSTEANVAATPRPTWTYTPYRPPQQPRQRGRRPFSSSSTQHGAWKVPNQITIPQDRIDISFQRSSGAGGQNVNKVNTKVELRFKLHDATWIPLEVRQRLQEQEPNRINRDGVFSLSSQEFRTQSQNRKVALSKLQDIILAAYPRPKERKLRTGVSKATKERNKEQKRRRSQVKSNRGRVDF